MMIIITTVSNKDDARKIARSLVENKLAACVSMFPVESTYWWEDKIWENESEVMLFIKTLEEKMDSVIDWLKKNHPYTVPEIVTVKAEAHGKYVDWIVQYLVGLK